MNRIYAPNRIKELRKARGYTQERLAMAMDAETTKGTVAKLETRQMALSVDYINAIARVLRVRPSELIEPSSGSYREIPLLGGVAAGAWKEAVQAADEAVAIPESLGGPNLFALRTDGDSMDQIVPDGAIIVVNPEEIDLKPGKVYVLSNSDHETTFKRFLVDPPRFAPMSNNPVHQSILIGTEPFLTIGRAVFAMFPLWHGLAIHLAMDRRRHCLRLDRGSGIFRRPSQDNDAAGWRYWRCAGVVSRMVNPVRRLPFEVAKSRRFGRVCCLPGLLKLSFCDFFVDHVP